MRRFLSLFILLFHITLFAGEIEWRYSQIPFQLGPVNPSQDLRMMMRSYIVNRTCNYLDVGAFQRMQAFEKNDWQSWQNHIKNTIKDQMGEMPFGENGAPLNVRLVSRHKLKHCTIENVLFESYPGWDVNASVFLPDKEKYPPPWQAIVVPVGHSSKTRKNYQIPAQVFASLGYVAVIFDPPGMAGEKQGGNDHFTDGVRCYLTGTSSNRYFIMDAIRCMDYLESRPDIDTSNGFGMTGVSGGGATTMYATLLDDRITASGPSCCALPSAHHPIRNTYAPCTETLLYGRFKNGVDNIDLLCAAIPTPVLFMFGEKDEVFKLEYSLEISNDVHKSFKQAGIDDKFSYFADTSGHAYTIPMALKFTKWMDKWVRKDPDRKLPKIQPDQFKMLPDSMLFCYPGLDGNIFSLNKVLALEFKNNRNTRNIQQKIKKTIECKNLPTAPPAQQNEPTQVWVHNLEELTLYPEKDIELPCTFMYPILQDEKKGAILYFDDRGRWTDLRKQTLLSEPAHFLKRDQERASVFTVDLRGWGDTKAADMPYDIASWAHSSRWLSYVSAGMGDHTLAMRIRDGLASLAYLRTRTEIDTNKIIVGGYGLGGVVAQHIAALDDKIAGVFTINSLATFESLATSENYTWSQEAFLPNVLKYYDLPEIISTFKIPTLIINPLDAEKNVLTPQVQENIYALAKSTNKQFEIITTENILDEFKPWAEKLVY